MSDGFSSLMQAVADAGGTLSQRASIGFAPIVLKTIGSFKTEAGAVDTTMLALVATDVAACESLILGLDGDASTKVVLIPAQDVRDSASQLVAFGSLRSHVENACKTRKVSVACNRLSNADGDPIGFTVRRIVK